MEPKGRAESDDLDEARALREEVIKATKSLDTARRSVTTARQALKREREEASKRYEAESDHRRRNFRVSTIALVMSAASIFVALLSVAIPIALERFERDTNVSGYLRHLSGSTPASPQVARGFASSGSKADRFAEAIGLVWISLKDAEVDLSKVEKGSYERNQGGWDVCFPAIDVLAFRCAQFANFEFSDQQRITRFTVGGVPVETIFSEPDFDDDATSEPDQVRAFYYAKITDPAGTKRTLVLWIDRSQTKTAGRAPISLSSAIAQGGNEERIEILATHFPKAVSYWDSYTASVLVSDKSRYLYVCWSDVPETEDSCDWIYGLKR